MDNHSWSTMVEQLPFDLPEGNISIGDLKDDICQASLKMDQGFRFQTETETVATAADHFSDEIYQQLPSILKLGCDVFNDEIEKEVFLFGAIGILSGLLPNIKGYYDGRPYESNLYCCLLANYGTGKGSLPLSRLLAAKIHEKKRIKYTEAMREYSSKMMEYHQLSNTYRRSKNLMSDPPSEPEQPCQEMLFIPANNSKTGLFELLSENKGRGILFETEGDTIADAVRQDYGNYSDGLRKAFHHEPITYYRRKDKEFVEIDNPYLTVIFSATYDQLLNLIPNINNGLFSRFLYYELEGTQEFKNVFDDKKNRYIAHITKIGEDIKIIYDFLSDLKEPIHFTFSTKQKLRFIEVFNTWKRELRTSISEDFDGTIHRLGLICFRIAMVITALRAFEKSTPAKNIQCNDQDFEISIRIIEILKNHSLSIYNKLECKHLSVTENKAFLKAEQIKKAKELQQTGLSYAQIAKIIFDNEKKKGTIFKWLKNLKNG